ncbi:type I DNA topoisomerase [[Mycoplasma] mobile]|uniref:DNA topoisomerase 1 n=1 Tax=Mycoplasma mobile (strain ATCC 43663 / 163K / NCTC 11711) TaxID=267748 RepID=Q6KIK8_MYCM1|nr:type I DNA topoisomerase [[Mycoplasma] mobile]AAT27568.1 DNA topoisomerase I [Mycoplasma mobile 163K]
MAEKVVIVESPNKVKTISKYLGKDYEVLASVGHIVKLPASGKFQLGIDLENWEPQYVLDPTKKKVVSELKKAVKNAKEVFIATDLDREGEAIGENLVHFLNLEDKYSRIRYGEITKNAILTAMENPTKLDLNLVNAQKARRMLDRIIGFRLSKLMASKLSNYPTKPTAGRVQSIGLKLIIDRENEIKAFEPEKYHTLEAKISEDVVAEYFNSNHDGDHRSWIYPKDIEKIKKEIKGPLEVKSIKTGQRTEAQITPLKQSVVFRKVQGSSNVIQSAMQRLYEGYDEGGLISYPRTDSTRLSQTFINESKKYIEKKFGKQYFSESIKGVAGDQDAHEAIRPTDVSLTPEMAVAKYGIEGAELRVYTFIYNTTLQALMKSPIRSTLRYELENNSHKFKLSSSKVIFDGYYVIDGYDRDKELPIYTEGQKIEVKQYVYSDHETKPPARYNDGTLIQMLDDLKIGRPSTFAATVSKLKERLYVKAEATNLEPSDFGFQVLEKLLISFPGTINEEYTAKVEADLDLIAENKIDYKKVLQDFWDLFSETLDTAYLTLERTILIPEQVGEECPDDGGVLIYKNSRRGDRFIACANWPECTFTRSIAKKKWFNKKKSTEEIN